MRVRGLCPVCRKPTTYDDEEVIEAPELALCFECLEKLYNRKPKKEQE